MKALIVTAILTLLAGCASTGASGDMGNRGAAGSDDYSKQDRIFNSWVN